MANEVGEVVIGEIRSMRGINAKEMLSRFLDCRKSGQKPGQTVRDYVERLETARDELLDAGEDISDSTMTVQFVQGLDEQGKVQALPSVMSVRTKITRNNLQDLPSYESVKEDVISHERTLTSFDL